MGTPTFNSLTAWVYAGQWVASCGHPYCGNVEGVPVKGNPGQQGTGALARIGQRRMVCTNCGSESVLRWPPPAKRAAIAELLKVRVVRETRNWHPHETLEDLEAENEAHPEGVR